MAQDQQIIRGLIGGAFGFDQKAARHHLHNHTAVKEPPLNPRANYGSRTRNCCGRAFDTLLHTA